MAKTYHFLVLLGLRYHLVSDDDERQPQGIISDMMLDCSLPPGQPFIGGCRQLVELKTISQRIAITAVSEIRGLFDLFLFFKHCAVAPSNLIHRNNHDSAISGL